MISTVVVVRPQRPLADGTMLPIRSVVLECGHAAIAGADAKVGDPLHCGACQAAKRYFAGLIEHPRASWWRSLLSRIRSLW